MWILHTQTQEAAHGKKPGPAFIHKGSKRTRKQKDGGLETLMVQCDDSPVACSCRNHIKYKCFLQTSFCAFLKWQSLIAEATNFSCLRSQPSAF
ncbi:unnamed protein product [Pleuronectes platessa]|uniref:Uncharacterized protein n=1 Tax=Pleuronectes platessa TaxID=8262 RepID=A0A9N7U2S8_PLEPL|nr:unnamed protein product [Pleuronectes platessa]